GYMAHGGHGCISVTANVAPKLCAEFQDACLKGNYDRARELHDRLMPLHDAMFCEPSPAPAKFGASLLGHCTPEVRLPLVDLTEDGRAVVRKAMKGLGLVH
ncbi:MAG: dihydrodipicolinate synthase family protein, partial [Terriglobia bacterium]